MVLYYILIIGLILLLRRICLRIGAWLVENSIIRGLLEMRIPIGVFGLTMYFPPPWFVLSLLFGYEIGKLLLDMVGVMLVWLEML